MGHSLSLLSLFSAIFLTDQAEKLYYQTTNFSSAKLGSLILPHCSFFLLQPSRDHRGNVLRPHEAQLLPVARLLVLRTDAPRILRDDDVAHLDVRHGRDPAVLLLPPGADAQHFAQVQLREVVRGHEQSRLLLGLALDALHEDHVVLALPRVRLGRLLVEHEPSDAGAAPKVLLPRPSPVLRLLLRELRLGHGHGQAGGGAAGGSAGRGGGVEGSGRGGGARSGDEEKESGHASLFWRIRKPGKMFQARSVRRQDQRIDRASRRPGDGLLVKEMGMTTEGRKKKR
mmetsp:Transcript_29873/g.55544  ORF Transcript_29873/g.55544 Transcript_29873/m.55544 type:complete len:285 (-) Transcript_29873:49-903(-)